MSGFHKKLRPSNASPFGVFKVNTRIISTNPSIKSVGSANFANSSIPLDIPLIRIVRLIAIVITRAKIAMNEGLSKTSPAPI